MLLAKCGALRERSSGKRMSKGQTFGRKLAGYDPAAAEVPGLAGPGGF
jgi:hypothetical protein